MLGVTFLLIAAQVTASIKPALNVYALSPKNADPAPTIDGTVDTVWGTHNSSVMPIQIGGESALMRVYTCVFNDFIYFGLQVRTSTHEANESLAIACSNAVPGSTSVNESVRSYSVAKIVRIDGKSWDWKIYPSAPFFSNWTPPSAGGIANSIDLKVGFGPSNFSFYEMRIGRVLPRPSDDGGDLNWTRKNSYVIKIFYGTEYANITKEPQLGNWTVATQKITLTIPAAPDDPTSDEIEALELNELALKVTTFAVSGFALTLVGFYVVRTKGRIRRL